MRANQNPRGVDAMPTLARSDASNLIAVEASRVE
jgi:hypothetical protein